MRHIKGELIKKIVVPIRADKSGVFDKILSEEDKNIVSSTILTANWYPYDTFKRCYNAFADVYAKGNMEVCRQWGSAAGEELTTSAYKTVISDKNYKVAFQKLQLLWKMHFDFGELDVNFISDNELQITLKDFDPDNKVFYYFARGWYEQVLIMCDCKDVKSEFLEKSWEGAEDTIIQLSWTS